MSEPSPKPKKRGRPPNNDPIYITSLHPRNPDPDLLAKALLAHYRNITATPEMRERHKDLLERHKREDGADE
ncbi:hypothetical protein HGQ17_01180 [Nesterenkonia sp. MY13]|uniref:Uncharacterized protein n=1 Tax=Nesterenkonia sedimenti TaxID=1463632 RepID=A0A7X8TIF0_9MICC|nr:hypothetical protein [Nesterenkonia sedimenti]NLS08638.1 hypothetical protein [Nesterenkonia sedimenti]